MPRKVQVSHADFAVGVEGARIVQSDTLEARTTVTSIVQYSTGHVSLFSERLDGTTNLFQFFAPAVPVQQRAPEGIAPGEPLTLEDSVVDQMEPEIDGVPVTAEMLQELAQTNPDLARLLAMGLAQQQAERAQPPAPPQPTPAEIQQVQQRQLMEAALRDPVMFKRITGLDWRG